MNRLLGISVAATTVLSTAALAAVQHERVRGAVTAVSAGQLTVQTTAGQQVPITLGSNTKYSTVVKSSLDDIQKGSYIGVATKDVGATPVALEVVVFPPAMKGVGEGHRGWDKILDTTVSGGGTTANSAMTNGSVAAVSAPSAVSSSMTNGSVAASSSSNGGPNNGGKQLKVTYKGGEQTILVPPTAPIVTLKPGSKSELTKDTKVFVSAARQDGKLMANAVTIGADGLRPPM